jgi:histidyl-tRNA synthetase
MTADDTKGFRDNPPRIAQRKQRIRDTIRNTAQTYGYQPLETPVIESERILTSKFTGGEEILKEMYTLTDNGDRRLGLRYDLTVPFARFIAEHPELKQPFKRYQNGPVFRDGPIKQGRYREFEQFDLDIVGSQSRLYDAELITIVDDVLTELDIPHTIQVNTRGLLEAVISHVGIPDDKADSVILTIDKYEKKGRSGVEDELSDKGLSDDDITELLDALDKNGSNDELLDAYSEYGDISDLRTVHRLLDEAGVSYELNPYLARGLTYYTGTIFEAFTTGEFDRSIAAGGRYDDMVGDLSSHTDTLPGVGASFGVDTLLDCTETTTGANDDTVLVIPMADIDDVISDVQHIRGAGVDVMLADPEKSFHKNMDYADKEGYGYLLVIGSDELESGEYTVKNLSSGNEVTVGLNDVADALKEI